MEKNIDEYLECKMYKGHPRSEEPEFSKFEHEGEFYFAMLDKKDGVALKSEGYTSAKGRDNGIASVLKNREIDDRISIEKVGKYHFIVLKAGNSQEIARSCRFTSGGSAKKAIKGEGVIYAASSIKKRKRRTSTTPKVPKVEVGAGSYPCSGISYKIFKSGNGKHYFTYRNKEDKAILISSNIRGYDTIEETQKIIDAIAVNGSKKDNFEERPTANAKFFYYLKNDEGKNIGKSFFFDTEAEMRAAMKLFDCGMAAATPKAAPVAAASTARQDDYLKCSEYGGHSKSSIDNSFDVFEQDGEYYFAWVDYKGDVILRSEGYTTEKARDNGINSVIKNRSLEERWSVDEKMGYYFAVLKAGNHQEIGRGCPKKDRAAATWSSSWGQAPPPPKAAPVAAAAVASVASKSKGVQDDYLRCAEYKGHAVSSVHKDFTAFEKDGEYFFAWIGKDGEVVLRSERYQSAKARDNGINSVLKNRKDEKKWSVEEKMGYHFNILKAGNHQEIGRSCPIKEKAAAGFSPLWFAAPAAAAAVAAVPKAKPTPPPAPKKVVAAAAPVKEVAAATTAAAATGSKFPWWLILLGLLGLLAFMFWKGCFECNTPAPPPPPVVEEVVPEPKVEVAPVVEPEPVAAVCNCNNQTDPVFRLPSAGAVAKKLSRLGTNPEFGDSHNETPASFLARLQREARASGRHSAFLERMYKGMGYGSFADAKPEHFSAVELPIGQKGNLGAAGKRHKTGYYELPDSKRDRQAFRIEAANGCHLHFMKTCGNHMFFCPN